MKTFLLKAQTFNLCLLLLFSLNNAQDSITFSKDSGFYPSDFSLTLTSSNGAKIYYTTDGSDPTNSNTVKEYTGPIQVKDRSNELIFINIMQKMKILQYQFLEVQDIKSLLFLLKKE